MKKYQIRSWGSRLYGLLLFLLLYSCNQPARNNTANQTKKIPDPAGAPVTLVSQGNQDKPVRLKIPHYPLRNEKDLDILLNQIGNAKVVLLGEASHGTSEYYTWRAAISKRLIQEKGFDFIAVVGEWADS